MPQTDRKVWNAKIANAIYCDAMRVRDSKVKWVTTSTTDRQRSMLEEHGKGMQSKIERAGSEFLGVSEFDLHSISQLSR